MKIFKPEIFQGSLNKKNYFEGWYYKHVSHDQDNVFAFIPGISLTKEDRHAFIQIINGLSGESHYISYSVDKFKWKRNRLFINIGKSVFTDEHIELNIDGPGITVEGLLSYRRLSPYPKSLLAPGIMGWYSYVPFMECYHGVVSANHSIHGTLEVNSSKIDFNGGKGYIEKDWGTSFPECWIWLQSNSFNKSDASLFVSIAKIPWLGSFFMGFIAFIYLDGQYIKFSTYNRSSIEKIGFNSELLEIELSGKIYKLKIHVRSQNSGELIAPHRGDMSRRIRESIDSEVQVQLVNINSNKLVFKDTSKRAGLEIIDKIFDYF